jgi:transposase
LDRVAEKLEEKYDKIYDLHDNARPHISKSTREKLLQLGWTTVPHPPYSPDLAPTDYHLDLFQIIYVRKNLTMRITSKVTFSTFSIQSHEASTRMEYDT